MLVLLLYLVFSVFFFVLFICCFECCIFTDNQKRRLWPKIPHILIFFKTNGSEGNINCKSIFKICNSAHQQIRHIISFNVKYKNIPLHCVRSRWTWFFFFQGELPGEKSLNFSCVTFLSGASGCGDGFFLRFYTHIRVRIWLPYN